MEMKIALAKIVTKYRIALGPETRLEVNNGDLFLLNYDRLMVKLEER